MLDTQYNSCMYTQCALVTSYVECPCQRYILLTAFIVLYLG